MENLLIKSKSTKETYNTLVDLLENNKRVFYSRFGDGDMFIMMGRSQANHNFSVELQKEMIESFFIEHECYLKGLAINYPKEPNMSNGFMAPFNRNDEMYRFLVKEFNFSEQKTFESAWFTHYYSIFYPDIIVDFLNKYIRPKTKLFVGNIPKDAIEKLLGKVDYYVEIPAKNAYKRIDEWWPKVLEAAQKVEVVIPAAGMGTRVINKRLWQLNIEVHSIDLGSIVDTVMSKKTRRWIRLKGHVMHRILLPPYNKKGFFYVFYYLIKEMKFKISCYSYQLKHGKDKF